MKLHPQRVESITRIRGIRGGIQDIAACRELRDHALGRVEAVQPRPESDVGREGRLGLHASQVRDLVQGGGPGALQQVLELAVVAEPLERKLRIEGQKAGRLSALDLPGQIRQARALGILTEAEAQLLADYDRRVMQIIDVDDFAPHELGLVSGRTFPRAIAPTIEGDQTCAS